MITEPVAVVGVLVGVLALIYWASTIPQLKSLFKVLPVLVLAYFVPTLLSNTGILPVENPAYSFVKRTLLPASLLLLTLSIDIPQILRLGKNSLVMFLGGTLSVFLGCLLSYSVAGYFIPREMHSDAWKGLAALCGSWIGGGANFVAVGESVGASQTILGLMVIVDVGVAAVWMAVLFYFAGKQKELDAKINADRTALDEVTETIARYQQENSRVPKVYDLLQLFFFSIGGTALCTWIAKLLPEVGTIINGFTWVVLLVTTLGVLLSFTPARKLEAAGASTLGSTFLYLLIAVIGAQGDFRQIVNAPSLILVGAVWMIFHAGFMLALRRLIKAPIFFLAVGSQANIGAAASAPVVASAFNPALSTVGVLLAILGYVLGTYLALLAAFFLEKIYYLQFATGQ